MVNESPLCNREHAAGGRYGALAELPGCLRPKRSFILCDYAFGESLRVKQFAGDLAVVARIGNLRIVAHRQDKRLPNRVTVGIAVFHAVAGQVAFVDALHDDHDGPGALIVESRLHHLIEVLRGLRHSFGDPLGCAFDGFFHVVRVVDHNVVAALARQARPERGAIPEAARAVLEVQRLILVTGELPRLSGAGQDRLIFRALE